MIINELGDEIVYKQDDYIVLLCQRPFATGYNVYKLTSEVDGKAKYDKANPALHWFDNLEAAKGFIIESSN